MHHLPKVIRDRDSLHGALTANARARESQVPLGVRVQREAAEGLRVVRVEEVFEIPGGPGADDGVEGGD
jgi:hypothetical protein